MMDRAKQILESALFVSQNADFVTINKLKINEFSKNYTLLAKHYWLNDTPFDFSKLSIDQKLMFTTIFCALSFGYWSEVRWRVEYQGILHERSSWSMVACILRALDEGVALLEPTYLENISKKQIAHILRGTSELPLLDVRAKILNQIGSELIKKYNSNFSFLLSAADNDAVKLLDLIIETFPFFDDSAEYKNKKVYFQKRPQALVEGVSCVLQNNGSGYLKNMKSLTALADYMIPRTLQTFGMLEYSSHLLKKITNQETLAKGSPEEVEIRSCTIWAIELIRRELGARHLDVTALDINNNLWSTKPNGMFPFHRTRTAAY